MAGSTALVASLAGKPSLDALHEIPDSVTLLEIRGNLAHDLSPRSVRRYFSGELLYALPNSSLPLSTRHRALIQAAGDYDLVQLEAGSDLSPEVLSAIPAQQRLICWKGRSDSVKHLRSVFERISAVPARFYSLITQGERPSDGIIPLRLLKQLGRRDVVAFCEGKAGFWSRILAPYFGAPLVFGKLDESPVDDSGEPSLQRLVNDYGFPAMNPVHELYGIVGNRVFQSPSPRLHNAGYRALGHPALFLPFYVECFEDFSQEMIEASALDALGLSVRGLTIVSPYKEAAFAAAAMRSPMASRAGASNIFLRKNGFWEAHTTDTESIIGITHNGHKLANHVKAAVIGCGGAGRAIAAALQQSGAQVTLVNRGKERGELAVSLLGLPFISLRHFRANGFSLLVNATPVGRDDDSLPFDIDSLASSTVVVDLVYGARPTPLVTGVVARGGSVIDGYDVLLNQVRKQFHMMTGREMPAAIGRHTVTAHSYGNPLCATEMHLNSPSVSSGQMAD